MSDTLHEGCMVAFRDDWSKAKVKPTLIGLLYRWSGRADAHLRVIVLDKKRRPLPYLLYEHMVVRLTGYDDLRDEIVAALVQTRKGRKAAAATEDAPAADMIPAERPTQRGRLDMHDVPYRTADVSADFDYESATTARGWNGDVRRYLTTGGDERDYIKRLRDTPGREAYYRDVVAPNAHGQRQKANLHSLMTYSTKSLEKGEPKP